MSLIVVDPALVELIGERRVVLEDKIQRARGVVGNGDRGVTILAVSKTQPAEVVMAAMVAGFNCFGENYAAEFAAKAVEIDSQIASQIDSQESGLSLPRPSWQFIGQLQTNKVRVVVPHVDVVQSVDRPSLVKELAKRSPGLKVMVQVELVPPSGGGIEGRGGVSIEDAPKLLELARSAGLTVIGAMGVAPIASDREVAACFGALRAFCDDESLPECSMGMTNDFEVAVAEGATMVRIGSAIFGDRR